MPTISSLRSKKAVVGATVLAPTPGAQPSAAQDVQMSRRSSIQPPPPAAGVAKASVSASSSRPKAPAPAAAPPPVAVGGAAASPPLTRGVSLLRKAPRSKLSQVSGARTSLEEGDVDGSSPATRSSAGTAPAPAAPAASSTRSGIPTSSRPASAASAGPASRPSSSIATRRTSRANSPTGKHVVHVEASGSTSPSASSRPQPPPDALHDDDSAASTPTLLARSSTLSPEIIGPVNSAASSKLRRSTGGAASSSANGSPASRSPPRRAAVAQHKANDTVVVVQKSRAASESPHKQVLSGKIAGSASRRPAAATETTKAAAPLSRPSVTTHRRSLSTSQAPSPPVHRPHPSSTTTSAVRPRPRPVSMIAPPGGGIGSSLLAGTTSPSSGVVKPRLISAIPVSPKPSVLRAPSGQATPTQLGHGQRVGTVGRAASTGVEVVVTPSRGADDGLGLPPRSSLSYPSPQPLDALSPPKAKKTLPKSPLNRLSTAGRLVPRSSLVSFEAMSRTLLPAEDSLLVEEADTSEFGVALSAVVSPPSSFSSRTSRKRREATVSSDASDAPAAKDPFGSLSASSSTHSFIPLPVAAAPQTPDISHAALQSRLQQSLLAQAALQRELEAERARAHAAADADGIDMTADLTIELDAARLHVETLESREEATREETAALEELLQASQDNLKTAEARAHALQTTVDSLAAASDSLRQQSSQLVEALEKANVRASALQVEGERAMVDRWAAVARRAREELAACQGERETLALVEGMAHWQIQAA